VLPDRLLEKMNAVANATSNNKKHTLNIAIAYGGQQEIVDAVKKIVEERLKGVIKPSDLNETILKEHMYTNGQPYPDLIIRTGGEKRLSNFLPFQSVYSELIFTDVKWPAFTRQDFDNALSEYENRKRRFGA
jgi:tritrans,polycis-undecaprenyl-diphosphate synthase [geranylgeranyl-diphosphate specific]